MNITEKFSIRTHAPWQTTVTIGVDNRAFLNISTGDIEQTIHLGDPVAVLALSEALARTATLIEPKDHSVVWIIRNGEAVPMPKTENGSSR